MNIQQQCIQAYQKHKHLRRAGEEIGVPWHTVYAHLKNAGVPVTGDKERYGSAADRLAAKAEGDLLKLVPFAESQNRKSYQAKVDFLIRGYGVDLKSSRHRPNGPKSKSLRWNFNIKKQEAIADFFVCLAYNDNAEILEHTLLIPGEAARHYQSMSLSRTGKKWWEYEIKPESLAEFFAMLPEKGA